MPELVDRYGRRVVPEILSPQKVEKILARRQEDQIEKCVVATNECLARGLKTFSTHVDGEYCIGTMGALSERLVRAGWRVARLEALDRTDRGFTLEGSVEPWAR